MIEKSNAVPLASLKRLAGYLGYLKQKLSEKQEFISSVDIAKYFKQIPIVVKKDLGYVTKSAGRPRVGFLLRELIFDIEDYLGYGNVKEAVLAGAGRLGKTLLQYEGFSSYGLNIVAGFDAENTLIGTEINGKKIFDIAKLKNLTERLGIHIGVICVPKEAAQEVCDIMCEAGIKGIWNFAPVHLKTPEGIAVKNENMAASLAELSNQLKNFYI